MPLSTCGKPTSERHGHIPVHRCPGLDEAAPCARRGGIRRGVGRAPAASCATPSPATAGSRSTPRATPSSSPSRPHPERWPPQPRRPKRSRDGPIRVRIGIHTGTPLLTDEGYIGADVHKGARIAAAGHGGQVLVSAAAAALVDGAELRDLGLHRLKDLTAAERIFQARRRRPPAAQDAAPDQPAGAGYTVPGPRRRSSRSSARCSARDDVRLVTLTGPGGTGKTRLALQAVADAADHFPDGVWWVPLAAPARSGPGARVGGHGAGRRRRPGRAHRRQAPAAPARQLRAPHRRRRRSRPTAGGVPQPRHRRH